MLLLPKHIVTVLPRPFLTGKKSPEQAIDASMGLTKA